MTSFVYDSALEDQARARINFGSDLFKVMLVGAHYFPNRRTHSRRSEIFDEVTGAGYVAGGLAVLVNMYRDSGSDRLNVVLGGGEWQLSTLTAKGAVYYKSRDNPETDELIAFIDFDQIVSSLNGKFALSETLIQFQNKPELTL